MPHAANFVDRVIAINNFQRLSDQNRAIKFTAEFCGACVFGSLNGLVIAGPWVVLGLFFLNVLLATLLPQ